MATDVKIVDTLPQRIDGNDRDSSKAQENFDALQAMIQSLREKIRELEARIDAGGL